jgi:hypothetical protein
VINAYPFRRMPNVRLRCDIHMAPIQHRAPTWKSKRQVPRGRLAWIPSISRFRTDHFALDSRRNFGVASSIALRPFCFFASH